MIGTRAIGGRLLGLVLAAYGAMLASAYAEVLAVPVDFEGRQIRLAGTFEKPRGAGPFPAVILLHGCGGFNAVARQRGEGWASLLHQHGYATLMLDSFSARGLVSVCDKGAMLRGRERAKDVYAAAYVLAGRKDVAPERIAAIGFSHGGWTVLNAAAADQPGLAQWRDRLADRGKLAAVVGLYPACGDTAADDFIAPVLILIGEADDWTPAANCEELAEKPRPQGAPVRLKVYPGAFHGFDVDIPRRTVGGHTVGYDAAATRDARREVVEFLHTALK